MARETNADEVPIARRSLPRRDWLLIPFLIVSTTIILFAAVELGSRAAWPSYHDSQSCLVRDARLHRIRSLPNCRVKEKIPEGPWLIYDYNQCGYRTPDPCGPKPRGTLRVVFLGSSVTQGYHVPYEDTYAELTTRALAAATNRPVQNENLGLEGLSPLQCYQKVPETLALRPDLVVFAVSPFDLEEKTDPEQLAARNDPTKQFDRPAVSIKISPLKRLGNMAQASRTALMAQHFLYTNTDTYVRLSLSRGDKTDYLRSPLSPAWRSRFEDFNVLLNDMADRFRQAGIPFVVVSIPSHQIGALMSGSQRTPQTDPFEFGHELRTLVEKAGAGYVDGTEALRGEVHADRSFYLAESHLNSRGHALIAQALIGELQSKVIPSLAAHPDP